MTTIPDNLDTFATRLSRLMAEKGFNQSTLSDESGIERTCLNRMLKDRRHPDVFQIGVLAKCLDVSPDDLMSGLSLPPEVQRAVDKERERVQQLLAAEAAREEAVSRADQLAAELEKVQREREVERADAARAKELIEAKYVERLHEVERSHAAKERTSDTTIRNLKNMLERAAAKIGQDESTLLVLRNQIGALQRQLATERSNKGGSAVLGGLVGIALGRAMH